MRYKSFRIRNFKGIKDTLVNLEGISGANVFAFVGLNESGKTTILEAIHSFSPDAATSELLGGTMDVGVPYADRVPRHQISEFTGEVSVIATLSATAADKASISARLKANHGIVLNIESFPENIIFERKQKFERGNFVKNYFTLTSKLLIKTGKERRWREPVDEERIQIRQVVYISTPDIAYFPTFVFDFPNSIFLSNRGGKIDQFYRRVFQDILDYDNHGQTIEADIVGRVRHVDKILPWLAFLNEWRDHGDRAKIQHVLDRAGSAVSKLVFGRWNRIFGEETRGKEINISYEVIEGETVDARGARQKTHEHDISIKFQIRDGTRRFDINDRSLGFRWFFSFMLFTQFRVARVASDARPLLFLFDEPASNLHSAAQQKLIESFPSIAQDEHVLAYSTHSHYMIEPKWLEQTFIVTNRADTPPTSLLDDISLDDESLDVRVTSYRSFVNDHPLQTSYFQPILDRLDVVPSKLDIKKSSVIVEGKSDYYILRYCVRLLDINDLPLIPCLGASTFDSLVGLHLGWGLDFLFVLDGDHQGQFERRRYAETYGVPERRLITLDEILDGVLVVEGILDAKARERISFELGIDKAPDKSQIRRFFQERLASDHVIELGDQFRIRAASLIDSLRHRLQAA